ncbi:MAG: hypothetical protein PHU85_16765, partial [Phycisphaerae bacterium]|nr:hypothetical protein [Phycisphaerae bacterium]
MQRVPPLVGLLDFASKLAVQAGSLTLRFFQSARLHIDYKADATPVTEADRQAEALIREKIAEAFPEHAIIGEEFGEQPGHPGAGSQPRYRWIIDPIDGTKSFVHGVPLFGVMIALEVEGVAALGVLHFPALNETVAAAKGCGCHFNGTRCHVSATAELSDALLCSSAIPTIGDAGPGSPSPAGEGPGSGDRQGNAPTFGRGAKREDGYDNLMRSVNLFRTWGDCYGYAMVATGRADIMLDPK